MSAVTQQTYKDYKRYPIPSYIVYRAREHRSNHYTNHLLLLLWGPFYKLSHFFVFLLTHHSLKTHPLIHTRRKRHSLYFLFPKKLFQNNYNPLFCPRSLANHPLASGGFYTLYIRACQRGFLKIICSFCRYTVNWKPPEIVSGKHMSLCLESLSWKHVHIILA